jgi:hypothetical protein
MAKKGEKSLSLPRGVARVQFIANLDEIKRMVSEGFSFQHIHKTLVEAGKILMPLRTFTGLARPATGAAENRERKHGKRGRGIIEILACREEIMKKLAAGYTLAHVHRELSAQGKITTKYSNFNEIMVSLGIKLIRLEKLKTGAELAAEAAWKPPALSSPGPARPPGLWPQAKAAETSAETKPKTDDGSFGLEKKKDNEVF